MLKKSFAVAAFCLPATMAMAGAAPSFHYTVAANITAFNPIDLQVTLTVENAEVKQYASMATWNETIVTPCAKFAARALNHAHSTENVLGIIELRTKDDRSDSKLDAAELNSYAGAIDAEKSVMAACQKSSSPSPVNEYKMASDAIVAVKSHIATMQSALKP